MKRLHLYYCILAAALLLTGIACHRTRPQSPSNKTAATDSLRLQYVLMQQRLAEEADRTVLAYVRRQPEGAFSLGEFGYWQQRTLRTERPDIDCRQAVGVHYRCYDLSDQRLLLDTEERLIPDKTDCMLAIRCALKEMHYGEEAILVVPWYLAYGQQGTQGVGPYTNLIVELTVTD